MECEYLHCCKKTIGCQNRRNMNTTQAGDMTKNDMDTHEETCCAISNWKLMGISVQL